MSTFETDISPSIFQLERRSKAQNIGNTNGYIAGILNLVTIIARSLADSEWRAPASVTSPVCKIPIHRNPFLIINQIHKYTQMTHTFFVTYECTKLLCVSLTRLYHDSFSFKENTYPVLNQRHILLTLELRQFLPEPITRVAFFKTDPSTASGLLRTAASHILAIATRESFSGEPGLARFLFDT